MAEQKFTIEEILREYDADGKRSGIKHTSDKPLSHGTLETEKLVSAATSRRPLLQERAGYGSVDADVPEQTAEDEETLVDIKSTISHIKAKQTAKAVREAQISPAARERFPTEHLRRDNISFVQAAPAARRYAAGAEEGYDSAVKLSAAQQTDEKRHMPQIRRMEDSTRAKEKQRKKRRRQPDNTYAKESLTGKFSQPEASQSTETPAMRSRIRWEEEQDFYYQEDHQAARSHPIRQRIRSGAFGEDTEKRQPDDPAKLKQALQSLRSTVFFRFLAMLLLTIVGIFLAITEEFGNGILTQALTLRGYSILELALGIIGLCVMFPTVKNGLWKLLRFHADTDSMAALPLVAALFGTICGVVYPESLLQETVHLYMPCALFALFCSSIGRLLVIRRTFRNINVISRETRIRVLSYISQEETAELLTRGLLHDIPIATAVRKVDGVCDILRYSYSADMADALCKRIAPICGIVSLLIAGGMTCIRIGTSPGMPWLSFFCSLWALLLAASCGTAGSLAVNLPLEWESRKAAATDSTILGYQSVDDFFDTNALLAEATDLFPAGSVRIEGMKVFPGAKMDEVLLDAAGLVQYGGSILQNAFTEMIPDRNNLRPVDNFVCEDGLGLCGWIANRRVLLGGREMMNEHHIEGLPTGTREAELMENGGDILYLSVSGVLAAMFSVSISADPKVKRQMQALRQEHVALVLRSVDSIVSLRRLSALFDFPESDMKIVPVSMHNLFDRETEKRECVSASVTVGDNGFGAASLLLGAKKVRRAATMGVIFLMAAVLLGFSLAMIHIVTGAYERMTAYFFLVYHIILTLITVLAVRIR